jgi:hypothetical protein
MPKELIARFQIKRTYYVSTFGYSEEECFDNLDNIKESDLELSDEEIELVETDYASF